MGAARRWLQSEFERSNKDSGGRLHVAMDEFTQPPGPNPRPESRDRTVVSGHYDSRVSDPMNATADAPGANDDASGVRVMLEMARVMSRLKWDATLVFMAVAGEHRGGRSRREAQPVGLPRGFVE
jgi:hypothetical protein